MGLVRVWLPVAVCTAGLVILLVKRDLNGLEAACALIGAGSSIWLLNVLHRIGVSGDRERDEEDAARTYFDRHGRWPDEDA
jgi:hypothetical protein